MSSPAYYNEIDPYAAAWLRNLIAAGHLPAGDVDERTIVDVRADDLRGYRACHFFAGLGGWPYALKLASWPDEREIWTGSCPCQPFSVAGRSGAFTDSRHLWPVWRELIGECQPRTVAGEQVEAAIGHDWLDAVRADLERAGYAFAPVSLCAAGVGAPHVRQRLFFVADTAGRGRARLGGRGQDGTAQRCGLGDADGARLEGRAARGVDAQRATVERNGAAGFWSRCDWVACRDGVARPIEPGTFPLAHGATTRVGRLRAYGNAIVAPLAAEFIGAYLDVRGG